MKKTLIILLILSFLITPVVGDTINPITNFKTLVDFPDDVKSGEIYTTEFSFSSTHNTLILINFTITQLNTEFAIGFNEWGAHFILNGTAFNLNETAPGQFMSNATPINVSDHNLTLSFSSLPNIVPANYNYSLEMSSEQIEVAPSPTKKKRSSGGGSSTWPITTPTATATATPTPTPTPTPVPTPAPTVIPSEVAPLTTPEPYPAVNISAAQAQITTDYRPHIIFGGMIFLLAAMVAMILLGRKRKKARQAKK